MPPLTLNQASKEAKKSKSAILEAIKSGRLSAARGDRNQWQIEPAELFRVYPQNRIAASQGNDSQPVGASGSELEKLLAVVLEERAREREQLQATIADLRARLDSESEERRKLMAMLCHQAEQPEPAALVAKWFGKFRHG